MMIRRTVVCAAILGLVSIGPAAAPPRQQLGYAPSCRHNSAAAQEDRDRRAAAIALAKAIHAAQAVAVQRTFRYQPLQQLDNLPAVPRGFEVALYADRAGYIFAIKDTLDPCHFAVFSDERGLLYEKSAFDAPTIAS